MGTDRITPDYETAALKAVQILTVRRISATPIDPVPIIKSLPNVLMVTYADMARTTGVDRAHVVQLFGDRNQDAVTSVIRDGDALRYIVTYNQRLPYYLLQRALARELGHIVLGHDGTLPVQVRNEEALVFARYLMCPRPLIRALQESGIKLTVEVLGNITGCYEHCLEGIRTTPGIRIPGIANVIMRGQFADFVDDFVRYQAAVQDEDHSPLADFGTYMDGYTED